MPGVTAVTDSLVDRLVVAEQLEAALSARGMRCDTARDARGSALWAEAHDGLVVAAVITDDGVIDVEVANTQGPACTHVVNGVVEAMSIAGVDMDVAAQRRNDAPGGTRLAPTVRRHLLASGTTPAAALLDCMGPGPTWIEEQPPEKSDRRRIGGAR
jgi:hypothetical protein